MKKIISILVLLAFIFGFALLIDALPPNGVSAPEKTSEELLKEDFTLLREKVAAAGYEVMDSFVDTKFEGVIDVFSFRINFNSYTVATIPIVLCEDEAAAYHNCFLLEGSIKLPMRNGCIFAFPGKDYPENVLAVVDAIINGKDIPKNEITK